MTDDEMAVWIIDAVDISLSKLLEIVGHGSLVCCNPWGHKESHPTERLKSKKRKETRTANQLGKVGLFDNWCLDKWITFWKVMVNGSLTLLFASKSFCMNLNQILKIVKCWINMRQILKIISYKLIYKLRLIQNSTRLFMKVDI